MSGVVGFLFPDVTLANKNFSYSRQKLMRESRDNAKRLQRIKKIRQKQYGSKSEPSVIQIRGMQGSVSGKNLSISNQSLSLIWDGWGIGSSTLNVQKEDDFTKKTLKGQTIEFSYNFGLMTFGIGQMSLKPSGKFSDKVNSLDWEPQKSEGNFYFGMMRYKIGFMEALIGYRRGTYKFSEFKHTSSESTLSTPLEGSVGLITIGIGVEF
jgi:hypothetical protein